jgi:hypothetical protein
MNSLYHIIFKDGTQYEGGNITNTKWLDIPKDKKIDKLFYLLPSGDYLFLHNYDKYYQYIEVTKDLNGDNKGNINIEAIYVLGKRKSEVTIYKVVGDYIETTRCNENDEQIIKLNLEGWR